MNATSIGILGILFSLLGALLVIDKLLTFNSVIKRIDSILAVYYVKYFKRISFNILDQYLKLEPDATDKDLVITLRNRIRNDKPPDVGEWKEILEEWKEMKHETRSQISQKKKIRKKSSIAAQLRNVVMIRIMLTRNPYIFPLIFAGLCRNAFKVVEKYQIVLGVAFFTIGHILQILERVLR